MRTARKTALPVLLVAGLAATGAAVPTPATAAPAVQGAILARYTELGGPQSFLGQPLTDELGTPDGIGRYSVFQHGAIYWTEATGAWDVSGEIQRAWGSLGWEASVAGYPTSGEQPLIRGGAFQRFQGSQVYTQPQAGTHEVHGDIFGDWGGLGWENGRLGYPTSNELRTPSRPGAYNTFEGGAVYWSAQTGAHEVEGLIRQKWASTGWENGALGFPTSDELDDPDVPGGRGSIFEYGIVLWDPQGGVLVSTVGDYPSAVDKRTNTYRVDSVGQSFTYDANDEFYRYTDTTADPEDNPISLADFESELSTDSYVFVDYYSRDPKAVAKYYLIDTPDPSARAALRSQLAHARTAGGALRR